eukprot:TRINITY_DN6359_c1_g2_i1.p1 TRINITY_DN6359_c1_g2~~TRINITY_DN6359_c1_g2_i1.p1  ORF type:complete len:521 (+),score=134.94 TRINITY_DN6359_c1_g2_i1:143-1705(+)
MLSFCAIFLAIVGPNIAFAGGAEAPQLPWPFSWDVLPTFGFPGAAPRFMTPAEEVHFANFTSNLIWGLNATCIAPNGTLFPAICPESASWCYCSATDPENQTWVTNMDQSLQEQGRRLKAQAGSKFLPMFGYLDLPNSQQYYYWQNQFNTNDSYASLRLAVKSKGVIDCFVDNCNWQGMEYRQFDFRQPAAIDFFVEKVVDSLVNSPYLDGVFLDMTDTWVTYLCPTWPCTQQESWDIGNGSLAAIEATLAYTRTLGKVVSVSSHTSRVRAPEVYYAQLGLIKKYGNGIRYYEGFGGGFGMSAKDEFLTMLWETQTVGVPIHAHAAKRTDNPDWVELAQFLVAATDYSYFSYSAGDWNLDSFPWQAEFGQPLGKPVGPAYSQNSSINHQPWDLIDGLNAIYNMLDHPGQSTDAVRFLGNTSNAADCSVAAQANSTFTAFTWAGPGTGWDYGCYVRLDPVAASCFIDPNSTAPCHTLAGSGSTTSGLGQAYTTTRTLWQRDYEHLHVELDIDAYTATLAWN